jgi:hypothetical protein
MDNPDIYLLSHVHEFEDGHEDTKIIGIFSTREKAEAALDHVRNRPGFRDWPEGFDISEYGLDGLEWSEGYDTIRAGEYLPDDKSYREYFSSLAGVGDDIYTECSLCGSACPTTGMPDYWQCSCRNLSIEPNRRFAKAGDKTIRVFRLRSNRSG